MIAWWLLIPAFFIGAMAGVAVGVMLLALLKAERNNRGDSE